MSLRILVVEDHAPDRQVLRTFFERSPAFAQYVVKVIEAGDGQQGLELFESDQPQLTIIDLLLPKLDGLGLCKAIRALPAGKQAALLAVSGIYRDSKVTQQLRDELNVELLSKPLDQRRLTAAVRRLLKQVGEGAPGRWRRQTMEAISEEDRIQALSATGLAMPPPERLGSAPAVDLSGPQRGQLDELPLAALLVAAAAQQASGQLRINRGKLRKAIFIADGSPIFVDSNLRNETLGAYFVNQRVIDERQLAQAMQRARVQRRKLGEVLVQLGYVDRAQVEQGLQAQTSIKVTGALRWADGAFEFAPGREFVGKVPHCPIDAVETSLAALARWGGREDLTHKLSEQLDQRVRLTEHAVRWAGLIRRFFGGELFNADVGELTLRQLVDRSADGAALLVQVAALADAGMVALEGGGATDGAVGGGAVARDRGGPRRGRRGCRPGAAPPRPHALAGPRAGRPRPGAAGRPAPAARGAAPARLGRAGAATLGRWARRFAGRGAGARAAVSDTTATEAGAPADEAKPPPGGRSSPTARAELEHLIGGDLRRSLRSRARAVPDPARQPASAKRG